jgi:hypothetical protein
MGNRNSAHCTAFEGFRCIASGELEEVVLATKRVVDRGERAPVLIFDDASSEQIEVDFRGTSEDVLRRLAQKAGAGAAATDVPVDPERGGPRGPGRPKLGVVAREVTLLPRHWDWLNGQPGGASVALRKLVEAARRANEGKDRVRRSREATYWFMSAMAGNLPGFEEAARALFAGDPGRFAEQIRDWPEDIRRHLEWMSQESGPHEDSGDRPDPARITR